MQYITPHSSIFYKKYLQARELYIMINVYFFTMNKKGKFLSESMLDALNVSNLLNRELH